MQVTRRQFGMLLGMAPAAVSSALSAAGQRDEVVERRVYDRAGAVPPVSVLHRCGITIVAWENAGPRVQLTLSFPSLEERVRAWDRFNSDPEWCALLDAGEVRMSSITISPASRATV